MRADLVVERVCERERERQRADSRPDTDSELFNLQSNIEIQIFLCFLPIARESLIFAGSFFSPSQMKSRKSKFNRDYRKEGKMTERVEMPGRKKNTRKANKTPVKPAPNTCPVTPAIQCIFPLKL